MKIKIYFISIFIISFVVILLILKVNGNMTDSQMANQAAAELRNKFKDRTEIYDISYGNRFGELLIVVSCVSPESAKRIMAVLPNSFMDFRIYFHKRIWNRCDILPEIGRKIDSMVGEPYYSNTPEGQEELTKLIKETIEKENKIWSSWSQDEQRKFVSDLIKNRRKDDPAFANCGDKFLIDD